MKSDRITQFGDRVPHDRLQYKKIWVPIRLDTSGFEVGRTQAHSAIHIYRTRKGSPRKSIHRRLSISNTKSIIKNRSSRVSFQTLNHEQRRPRATQSPDDSINRAMSDIRAGGGRSSSQDDGGVPRGRRHGPRQPTLGQISRLV